MTPFCSLHLTQGCPAGDLQTASGPQGVHVWPLGSHQATNAPRWDVVHLCGGGGEGAHMVGGGSCCLHTISGGTTGITHVMVVAGGLRRRLVLLMQLWQEWGGRRGREEEGACTLWQELMKREPREANHNRPVTELLVGLQPAAPGGTK